MSKRFPLLVFMLVISHLAIANGTGEDFFRATGKIYVVFAVIISIFAGLIFFLFRLDRRISRIEKQINPS
jgi:hypothetical protein